MSLLLDLMTRLREIPARALPVIPRCVLHVVADHVNPEKEVSWPKVETIAKEAGVSESTARAALADLVRAGWLVVAAPATARSTARYEVRLDGRPISEVRAADPRRAHPRVPGATPQGAGSYTPEVCTAAPRVPGATPEAPSEAPKKALTEAPNEPHALTRDHARDDRPRATPIPFGPSPSPETTPIPTSTVREIVPAQPALPGFELPPEPPPPPAPPKPPTKAEIEQAVFDAWTEERAKHVRKGGVPVLDSKRRTLVHARLRDGFPLEDLIAAARGIWREEWFRRNHRTDFDLALRNAANVERFRPLGQPPPPPEPAPEPFRPKRIPLPSAEELDRRRDEAAARDAERNARLRNPEIEAALRPALERAAARMAAANG